MRKGQRSVVYVNICEIIKGNTMFQLIPLVTIILSSIISVSLH